MPITPLHFGILAPINQLAPKRVSNVSFILVNLWIDGTAILHWLFNLPPVDHTGNHDLLACLALGAIVAVFGFRSRRWIYGALLGGLTHSLLDAMVHPEIRPFGQDLGNPLYLDLMEPLSAALLVLTIWLIAQYVSGALGWLGRRRVARN